MFYLIIPLVISLPIVLAFERDQLRKALAHETQLKAQQEAAAKAAALHIDKPE